MTTNAWGQPVEESPERDPWHVPKNERLDHDHPDTDPNHPDTDPTSNALSDETGDDLDGWEPGDPV